MAVEDRRKNETMKQITFKRVAGEEAEPSEEGSAHVALRPDARYLMVARMPQGAPPAQRSKMFEALSNVAKRRKDSASTDILVLPYGIGFDVYEYDPQPASAE